MKKFFTLLLATLYLPFLSLAAPKPGYAIKNVNVIPMTGDEVLAAQTVLVKNGRIIRISPARKGRIAKKYHVIDGTGKYLMPGLMDMHVHFYYEQGEHVNTCDSELKMILANGVTTARIMAGHPAYLEARNKVRSGQWDGPDLFVASPQLAGRWPWSQEFKNFALVDEPEKAVAAVKQFKQEGYDQIKITFMVNRPVFDAIITAAQEEKIKVTGHVGPLVKLPAALAAGEQIEHMDEFIEMLLPDTSYNHGISVSDYSIYSKAAWTTVPHLMESKIPELARQVKAAGIYVTPTNYFFIHCFGDPVSDEAIKAMPDYNYIPPVLKEEKWGYRTNYLSKMASEESRKKYVDIRKKMVKGLWEAGVPLLAGSDTPEYFIVAGFALHKELEMMVAAGLTPFAALQTATVNPAAYLDVLDEKGTVEVGKQADLLLLDQNPLENISNTQRISGLFKNGKWYAPAAVTQLLEDAKVLGQ